MSGLRRRRCGTRKIDTKHITVRTRSFELLIYLEGDYSFTIVNSESSMKITGNSLKDLLEEAIQYLETYVGIEWEPRILVQFECGDGWNQDERKITFSWKPILVRDAYNDRGKKLIGKVYRDNDENKYRHTTALKTTVSKKEIMTTIADTPELRAALAQFSAAIDGAGERIAAFLRPETLEKSITTGLQKMLGG